MKKGEIYYVNFGDRKDNIGSEQDGVRPALIIQNDIGNKYSPTTICAVITSQKMSKKMPTHVKIEDYKSVGLHKKSVILLEQVKTIDKKRIIGGRLGILQNDLMLEVDKAIKISLGV